MALQEGLFEWYSDETEICTGAGYGFHFCTVGEEQGFVGSSIVLLLFLALILRLIVVSERQPSAFGRVYGYSVLSIFLFHVFINIGMVLGLTPLSLVSPYRF